MLKAILTSVVCWSFMFVVNGETWKEEPKYLPATSTMNSVVACMTAATIDEKVTIVLTNLSFRFNFQPQTTRSDSCEMVVLQDVLTDSTHPP